jgi:hypothetical protein
MCSRCVRPCAKFALRWAGYIRNGWRCQSMCIDGKSAGPRRTWGTGQKTQFRPAKACRTEHNGKPHGCPAFVPGAGQKCPFSRGVLHGRPTTASLAFLLSPDIRVGGISPRRPPMRCHCLSWQAGAQVAGRSRAASPLSVQAQTAINCNSLCWVLPSEQVERVGGSYGRQR